VPCRLIVIGGHTRSIGKTQPLCDLIAALRKRIGLREKSRNMATACAQAMVTIAIALYGAYCGARLGIRRCNRNGQRSFFVSGAVRSFWLRTKQGYLAEGMAPFRQARRRHNS
jgi:hypothetical protein